MRPRWTVKQGRLSVVSCGGPTTKAPKGRGYLCYVLWYTDILYPLSTLCSRFSLQLSWVKASEWNIACINVIFLILHDIDVTVGLLNCQ